MPTLSLREFDTLSMYLAPLFGGVKYEDIMLVWSCLCWLASRAFRVVEAVTPAPRPRPAIIVSLCDVWPLSAAPLALPVGA